VLDEKDEWDKTSLSGEPPSIKELYLGVDTYHEMVQNPLVHNYMDLTEKGVERFMGCTIYKVLVIRHIRVVML